MILLDIPFRAGSGPFLSFLQAENLVSHLFQTTSRSIGAAVGSGDGAASSGAAISDAEDTGFEEEEDDDDIPMEEHEE